MIKKKVKNLLKIASNSKLGKRIAGFSITAVESCPGKTDLCSSVCYATSGCFRYPVVKESHAYNLTVSKTDEFEDRINMQLKRSRSINAVRLQPAGDLYSIEYVQKWTRIAKKNPNKPFWLYTRSWRDEKFHPALKEFGALPNVQLFASLDDEIRKLGETPPSWMRLADMREDWDDIDASYVKCPNLKNKDITCAKCTYCFKPPSPKKRHVVFKIH